MEKQEFSVNLNKPLAFQVGHLGEAYDEWVHCPILTRQSFMLFDNDFIEWFTRTPWWVVPLVWLPVTWWFVSYPTKNGVPLNHTAITVIAGLVLFTFQEYSLHRFIFHIKTTTYWGNTLHYILHGYHHKHPMDNLRLVLPPLAAALISLIVLVPAPHSSALFGGVLLGYAIYDCTHYYLHHAKPSKLASFSLQLKRYHMNHHFKAHEKGFGVTTAFWDWVFGTMPPNFDK